MTTATAEPAAPKATLSKQTSLLFHIAAKSHTLADMFGVEQVEVPDSEPPRFKGRLFSIARPWLEPHPGNPNEYTFSADKFAERLDACSKGERHMKLFILNVWNPTLASSRGWTFDMFKAMNVLDANNRAAIAWWLAHPIYP